MSFSSSHQDTSGTSSYAPDPTLLGDLYGNYGRAQGVADTPFTPYSGQRVAGFTPDQTQAQAAYANIGNGQVGSAPLNSAIGAAQGVAGYAPQAVTAPSLSGVDLSGYMSPFQSTVLSTTLDWNGLI